jgi:pyruvate formate lyase activating enzyme
VARPVNIAAIKQSIALIRNAPIEYEFRTTVVKSLLSPDDLEEIAREIQGAKRYCLQRFVPTKILNPQFRRKTTYTDEEFEAIKRRVNRYVTSCDIR